MPDPSSPTTSPTTPPESFFPLPLSQSYLRLELCFSVSFIVWIDRCCTSGTHHAIWTHFGGWRSWPLVIWRVFVSLHSEQEVTNVLVVGPGSDACSRRRGGDTVPSRLLSWLFLPGRWGRCCLAPGKPSSNLWEMRHGSPSSFGMRARATRNP